MSTGCPVVQSHRKPIKWTYENQTLKQTPGLHYRVLAAGRIIEVHTLNSRFEGHFECQTHTNNQMISAWIQLLSQGQCLCIQVCGKQIKLIKLKEKMKQMTFYTRMLQELARKGFQPVSFHLTHLIYLSLTVFLYFSPHHILTYCFSVGHCIQNICQNGAVCRKWYV